MKTNFFYLKLRVELNKEVTQEELVEFVQELNANVGGTKDIDVVETTIEESALDYDFEETF